MNFIVSLVKLAFAVECLVTLLAGSVIAADSELKTIDFGIYQDCPVLDNGTSRAVFCPQSGGRILEYSLNGTNALFLSQYEKTGKESEPRQEFPSAGRFDIGPEQIVAKRPEFFLGTWTATATGANSLQLVSPAKSKTGVTLTRDFSLDEDSSRLTVVQTITNVSEQTVQNCHWSRTLANQSGIVLIPLDGFPRFPNRYVRYDKEGLQMRPQDDNIKQRDGFLVIDGPPSSPKLGMDSYAGWLAHQQPSGLLFIKQFPTYPNRNYCELAGLTISTWAPAAGYTVELEPIGPSETLEPGESASFTEIWSLHESPFPDDADAVDLDQLRAVHAALPRTDSVGPQP